MSIDVIASSFGVKSSTRIYLELLITGTSRPGGSSCLEIGQTRKIRANAVHTDRPV